MLNHFSTLINYYFPLTIHGDLLARQCFDNQVEKAGFVNDFSFQTITVFYDFQP